MTNMCKTVISKPKLTAKASPAQSSYELYFVDYEYVTLRKDVSFTETNIVPMFVDQQTCRLVAHVQFLTCFVRGEILDGYDTVFVDVVVFHNRAREDF
jgi:hypothetical protein